ncbi:MAG: DNA gyrase inhibitor YacG [Acidobacteria bacterium]|nr:DNA gyrase inhibitor YacG [Acidobacteriota bacterium]
MAGEKITLRCPACRKLVTRGDAEFPFCSERCRTIDLGKWASGGYVISTPVTDPEALESQPGPRSPNSQRSHGDVEE